MVCFWPVSSRGFCYFLSSMSDADRIKLFGCRDRLFCLCAVIVLWMPVNGDARDPGVCESSFTLISADAKLLKRRSRSRVKYKAAGSPTPLHKLLQRTLLPRFSPFNQRTDCTDI